MKFSSAIALLVSLLFWSVAWIVQQGALELVHVTHELKGLSGFLLLVGTSTALGISAAALLAALLPRLMGIRDWRRLTAWMISGAVLGEFLAFPLCWAFALAGYCLPLDWQLRDAFLMGSIAWPVLFAVPFGAANAAVLWKDNLRGETTFG